MKVAVLSANLGEFDTFVKPVPQTVPHTYHCWTDKDFPPITGLTPRFQYRIPKTHGWQMEMGYDIYVWLDASMSFARKDSLEWLIKQLGKNDMAFFKHPWRDNVKEEIAHIEDHLSKGKKYITDRYKNGLHNEQPVLDPDDKLYFSGVFIYKNTPKAQQALIQWWYFQSRYYTCDQANLPYALQNIDVGVIDEDPFNCKYLTQGKHK